MKDHLDASALNALVSGELSREERALAREHLAECASCTTSALSSAMLKLATEKAGARFVPSVQFTERITRQSCGMHIGSSGTPGRRCLDAQRRLFLRLSPRFQLRFCSATPGGIERC